MYFIAIMLFCWSHNMKTPMEQLWGRVIDQNLSLPFRRNLLDHYSCHVRKCAGPKILSQLPDNRSVCHSILTECHRTLGPACQKLQSQQQFSLAFRGPNLIGNTMWVRCYLHRWCSTEDRDTNFQEILSFYGAVRTSPIISLKESTYPRM